MRYLSFSIIVLFLLNACSSSDSPEEMEEIVVNLPSLSTNAITEIGETSATVGGNISNDGGAAITERGVVWATSANPTTADNKQTVGTGTGSFTASISDLEANTAYFVRAYAVNSEGTAYGSQQQFTTLEPEPEQKVFDGDVILTSQQEIDDFEAEGYTEITGSLTIKDTNAPTTIVSLEPLNSLESIGGTLEIANNMGLSTISGFVELKTVAGLLISNNNSLEEISGFQSLTAVNGNLAVFGNESSFSISGFDNINSISESLSLNNLFPGEIKEIDGFESLETIGGNLVIGNVDGDISNFTALNTISGDFLIQVCHFVEDLTFLSSVSTIGGQLLVLNNDSLISLNGLENIVLLQNNVWIDRNDGLISLMGLQNLTRIDGSLAITDNAIVNLLGLNSLEYIKDGLGISNNPFLESLDGIENLKIIDEGGLSIVSNDALLNINGLIGLEQIGNENLMPLSGGRFRIIRNKELSNIDGLINLTSCYLNEISINLNDNLENLDGLINFETLVHPDGMSVLVEINNNNNILSDLCGIKPLYDKYAGTGDAFFQIIDSPQGIDGFDFSTCN